MNHEPDLACRASVSRIVGLSDRRIVKVLPLQKAMADQQVSLHHASRSSQDREFVLRVYSTRDRLCREQDAFRAWFNK
eukprot:scaffold7363_cov263-Pinguiococcus_pyrenoidosus.AAC.22